MDRISTDKDVGIQSLTWTFICQVKMDSWHLLIWLTLMLQLTAASPNDTRSKPM